MRMRTAIAAAALAVAGVLAGGTCAVADAGAQGVAANSPGVLSGNLVQIPVHVPINVCGNTISVAGALNPASGTTCINS
ncbi:chaplin [Streptomyces sp. NPDC048111]|uniref:chaplin n=1 Tax=Streptomyces sp. NPDC048111 TaxID=3365500 RepID=UPI003717A957